MKKSILLSLIFSLGCLNPLSGQQIKPFQTGDRVTFVGNSITHGGRYHSYIWLYYMTHFPNEPMWMANCGVGGDTSKEIYERLDSDVFAKRPTVLTLTFGMNDSGYFEYNGNSPEKFGDRQVEKARANFVRIVKKLQDHKNVRVIMIGTSPYDQTSKFNKDVYKNKNNYIQKMIAFQDSTSRANKWEFLDFNAPMLKINSEQQAKDSTFTICGNDRIHPDNDGHMVMAYLFLKAQGFVGQKVADVKINARNNKVLKSDNCIISNIEKTKGNLSFNYFAKSLPFPLDTIAHGWMAKRSASLAAKYIPTFMKDIDEENLSVTGLKGTYRLTIDGVLVDTLSAQKLAAGINLALYRQTPEYQQALTISALNEDRLEIEAKFRDYAWIQYDYFMPLGLLNVNDEHAAQVFRKGVGTNGWVSARKELYDKMIHKDVRDMMVAQMDMLVKKIYEINKPKTRKVKLTLVNINKVL
jgi:lysophospholipase L1-like esterase